MDVRLKLPVLIPAKAAFSTSTWGDGTRVFAVHDAKSRKPHVRGTVTT